MSFSKEMDERTKFKLRNPVKIISIERNDFWCCQISNSKTFGKIFSCILSEKNSKSIYVPPGFAHGFLTLSKENFVTYSCTNLRHKFSETTIKYNDKTLKIKWPKKKMIISNKDKKGISFLDYKNR